MRVEWSPRALAQVQEITDYIARDKVMAARRWIESAFELADGLRENPGRGRIVPEARREDVREIFFGAYRIIFQVEAESIRILTVRHGRRLLDAQDLA